MEEQLTKGGFINLQFDKPGMRRYVIVPFTVQEAGDKREEYDSKRQLKQLIKKALQDTNWRLMSEEISLRVGYLYGQLKVYEGEEDLIRLVERCETN